MKKFLISAGIIAFVFSCAPKTMPVASDTSSSDAKPNAGARPSPENAAGALVFNEKCGRCHDLPKPSDHTEAEWKPIIDRMALKAKLDSTQKANVLVYVYFNAKPA